MEFLIIVDIFSIFLLEQEIHCQDRFQKISLLTNLSLFYFIFIFSFLFYFYLFIFFCSQSKIFLKQIAKSDKKRSMV